MTEVRGRWFGAACAVSVLAALTLKQPASALPAAPVLHEPIPPNPGEDLAMHVVLPGNLPAAIQTPKGALAAPDPQALPGPADAAYGQGTEHERFRPDRDTSRPEVSAYDDPFIPATAPFKRLAAFDAVRADYTLYVREPRLVPLPINGAAALGEDAFFADEVVDLAADQRARIPSVGPGARIVRAHLGVGARDVPLRIVRDGADNWFAEAASVKAPTRARLVLELAIARASLGGPLADPTWDELPLVAPLPDNVARDAAIVTAAIGVSRQMRPRQVVALLVRYFRAFTDSNETPPARDGVYLDLALSKKGVCRHRAFAFLVTAQSLGIPTRMILNEAHAWVEVHDGTLWHLIDLGGAGRLDTRTDPRADRIAYEPPADTFPWPPGADRGDAMNQGARAANARGSSGPADANPVSTEASPRPEGSESAGGRSGDRIARIVGVERRSTAVVRHARVTGRRSPARAAPAHAGKRDVRR